MIRLLPFINVLFYAAGLRWILDMEKYQCKCSEDRRRDFMKFYLMGGIAYSLVTILSIFKKELLVFLARHVAPLFFAASIAYSAVALSYFVDIKHKDCRCSMGPQREIMYWLALFQVIFSGLLVFGYIGFKL